MTVWRVCSVVVLLLGLWQLFVGLRATASTVATPTAASRQPAVSTGAAAAPAGWSTDAALSFSAQPALSLGLSPLDASTQTVSSDWERRLSDARSEQLRLEAMTELSTAQRQAALQAHLQQHFSAAERARVEAGLRLMPR